jgi:LysR family transcriptional regulator, regulator for bpeEF and oprC
MAAEFLADMALFVEVVNTKNFGSAARNLGVSPSMLSRRIRAMEQGLGVSLIQRSTRSFALTDAGAACYERSRKVISEVERIREEVGAHATQSRGRVRIGAPFDLLETIFVPILSEFVRSTPGVSMEVTITHGYASPVSAGLDLAIVVAHQTRLPDSVLPARRIGVFGRELYASNRYLKQRGMPKVPEDLMKHDCIAFSIQGGVHRKWELQRGKERRLVEVGGHHSADGAGLVAELAREDLGIAMIPEFLAEHPSHGAGLIRVLPDWAGVPAYLFAVTPAQIIPARIRRLVELLKARFEGRLVEAGR